MMRKVTTLSTVQDITMYPSSAVTTPESMRNSAKSVVQKDQQAGATHTHMSYEHDTGALHKTLY